MQTLKVSEISEAKKIIVTTILRLEQKFVNGKSRSSKAEVPNHKSYYSYLLFYFCTNFYSDLEKGGGSLQF